jgi:hypothetical protein
MLLLIGVHTYIGSRYRQLSSLPSAANIKPSLPLDIILIIIGSLTHHKDIQNMLQTFPDWDMMIPNTFWRSRFLKGIIFEYEEIADLELD